MAYKILAAAMLALSLAAPGTYAQTAPVANAVDPASIQALRDLGAHAILIILLILSNFEVNIEKTQL